LGFFFFQGQGQFATHFDHGVQLQRIEPQAAIVVLDPADAARHTGGHAEAKSTVSGRMRG